MKLEHSLKEFLKTLDQKGILRARSLNTLDSSKYQLCFCSNDYLGLSNRKDIREFYRDGFQQFATGSGASPLIAGYHPVHKALEEDFCTALNCEAGLLFSSGYTANLGVMALLGRLQINTLIDKAVHASMYDGLKLSSAKFSRYIHQDIETLRKKIVPNSTVVTEGIFSMSGYQPDLRSIADITASNESVLFVDEAHSFGITGTEGLGSVNHAGLNEQKVPLRIIPFGKSFASMGAIVVGKKEWIEVLLQVARSCIYSTAISPAVAYGIRKSLHFIREADEHRAHLDALIEYFKNCRKVSGFEWSNSDTPVQRIKIGGYKQAALVHQYLQSSGINTQLIRYPTVNVSETSLRICLTVNHTFNAVDRLFDALEMVNIDCCVEDESI